MVEAVTNTRIYLAVIVAVLCVLGIRADAADGTAADAKPASGAAASVPVIEVESVVLRLFEEAEVPAQESGVVINVAVRKVNA